MRARSCVSLVAVTVALFAAGTGAGCKRGSRGGSTCDAVGARFLGLAQADLAATTDLDPAKRRGVTGLLAPMRDAMVRACREDGWSTEARACMIAAADVAGLRACDVHLTEPQRELRRKAASAGIHAER